MWVFLGQDAGDDIIRGITFQDCFKVRFEVTKDWSRGEYRFQQPEDPIALWGPNEGCRIFWFSGYLYSVILVFQFLQQSKQRLAKLQVLIDEPSVEVCKAQKALDIPYQIGCFPIQYSFDFGRVHLYAISRDNKTKECGFFYVKLALFCVGI